MKKLILPCGDTPFGDVTEPYKMPAWLDLSSSKKKGKGKKKGKRKKKGGKKNRPWKQLGISKELYMLILQNEMSRRQPEWWQLALIATAPKIPDAVCNCFRFRMTELMAKGAQNRPADGIIALPPG